MFCVYPSLYVVRAQQYKQQCVDVDHLLLISPWNCLTEADVKMGCLFKCIERLKLKRWWWIQLNAWKRWTILRQRRWSLATTCRFAKINKNLSSNLSMLRYPEFEQKKNLRTISQNVLQNSVFLFSVTPHLASSVEIMELSLAEKINQTITFGLMQRYRTDELRCCVATSGNEWQQQTRKPNNHMWNLR